MTGAAIARVALVNFTGGRENWGCQATSWEWLKLINAAFAPAPPPDLEIVPLLPPGPDDLAIDGAPHRALASAMLSILTSGGSAGECELVEAACRRFYAPYADAVRRCDVVFFQGEGTMTGTDFGGGLRLVLLPFVAKHLWGKRVYAFNHTIQLCDPAIARVVRAALASFDFHAVREPASFAMERAAGALHTFHIPDTAFLTRPMSDARVPDLPAGRCFALTGTASPGAKHLDRLFAAADRIRTVTGLMPVLASSTRYDRALVDMARRHWPEGGYAVLPHDLSYNAVAGAFRRCALLLGGRYHMSILAACAGTPILQVRGNSHKNEGLDCLLRGLAPVHDVEDTDALVAAALALLGRRDTVAAELERAVAEIRAALAEACLWLGAELRGAPAPMPPGFSSPPGLRFDADRPGWDYCAEARAKAAKKARVAPKPPGPVPMPADMILDLRAACEAGDAASLAIAAQFRRGAAA